MNQETINDATLIKKIEEYIKDVKDLELINDAKEFSDNLLSNRTKLNDYDYRKHTLNVVYILANLKVDAITLIAAFVYKTIAYNNITLEEIENKFGLEVKIIVESLNNINKLKLSDDSEASAVSFRKMLVGMISDVRVLYIKLANRVYNLRVQYNGDEAKTLTKCDETMRVLIPIAHRLGINSIKSELEDLWLRYTKPNVYNDILEKLNASRDELNDVLMDMKDSLSNILTEHNLKFEIKARVKSVYSIYNKLATGRPFNDIYDILALRILLEEEQDCYLAVGLIHAKYRPIPKRFKDYIAMPKENLYQSLHTTVFGIDGYLFEVQLRTYEMNEIAELGLASHWSYKEKGTIKTQAIMEQKLEMFRSLIDANETNDDINFKKEIETDLFSKFIYVFTPKGDVVELPSGSTPIDFAYRIHSKVGDTTVGAIVNDNIVSLDTPLQDNDIVNIKTNSSSTPSKEWLNIVKTSQAKNKIKAYYSKKDKDIYVEKGKEFLEKEVKKQKLNYSELFNEKNIKKILKDLKLIDFEEILLGIGSLRYTANYIINLIDKEKEEVTDVLLNKIMNSKQINEIDYKNDIIVSNLSDIKVNLSACCFPVFGDNIIGYITKGNGISIHRKDCSNLSTIKERLIDVKWNKNSDKTYQSVLLLKIIPDNNLLLNILNIATQKEIKIDSFNTLNNKYELVIKVKNITDLNKFIGELEKNSNILQIERKNY